ncbi:hypothetical protein DFS34DRAFT_653720 [Phlyctochytrium arcticum]|nr:hypothetical protein DFS34DRAFT_653720 [Phlyctochytrium arcticum]
MSSTKLRDATLTLLKIARYFNYETSKEAMTAFQMTLRQLTLSNVHADMKGRMEELKKEFLAYDYNADQDWVNYWATKTAQKSLKTQAVRKHAAYGEVSTAELERTAKRLRAADAADEQRSGYDKLGLGSDNRDHATSFGDSEVITRENFDGNKSLVSLSDAIVKAGVIEDAENNCFLEGGATKRWMQNEVELHVESDPDFDTYDQPRAPSPDAPPTEAKIQHALISSYRETFNKETGPARVHAMTDRTYIMFVNLTPNVIADDSTAELRYRSSFIDRLFESCVGGGWIKWISGEMANESVLRVYPEVLLTGADPPVFNPKNPLFTSPFISRARAVQADAGTPSAPKHDGIGCVDLGGTEFGIAFLEVVGGTSKENKTKERTDTIKILKSMALSTDI